MKQSVGYILILIKCMTCLPAFAQEDSLLYSIMLDSVYVRSNRYTSELKTSANGNIELNIQLLNGLPQILGNADPIHYLQTLPGIQTKGEYRSGINIYGNESSHNMLTIERVPLYGVNHLLGLFSILNASHYQKLQLIKSPNVASFPNRLGGDLQFMYQENLHDSISGELSVGLISSQGTVRIPIGEKSDLSLSLRASYLNLLYSSFLSSGGVQFNYSFYDGNFTFRHNVNERNKIIIDSYLGNDNGAFDEDKYLANMHARWSNYMYALHWLYENGVVRIKNTFYSTTYRNRFNLGVEDVLYKAPSSILDCGYRGLVEWRGFTAGVDVAYRFVSPQNVYKGENSNISLMDNKQEAYETSLYINYKKGLGRYLDFSVGLRGDIYNYKGERSYSALNPSISIAYENYDLQLVATYALRHQYLFQTGFVDCGLPTEFWLLTNNEYKPQYAHSYLLGASRYIFNRLFMINIDLFYKSLYNQVEYSGAILDLLNSNYSYEQHIHTGVGRNIGFGITLNKCTGKLEGWLGYTYTKAKRIFRDDIFNGEFSAIHERPHELNALLTYSLNKRWNIASTFVFASGTPFTAPENIALVNGGIIIYYGKHNAMRLRPYCRLDLSVDYKWNSDNEVEHSINFSLHNATACNNELFYGLKTNSNGNYAYRPVTFALKIMPSISYFCKF